MADQHTPPGAEESLEIIRDRTRAWWTSVLAGQVDQSHPVHGTEVNARVEGDTLIITGKVPAESDLHEIQREAHHLRGHGIAHIRSELQVVPETMEEKGVLVQTLLGVFETAEQAGFAAGYLEGHAHIQPDLMRVVAPDDPDGGTALLHAILPAAYWEDGERALEAGRALLIVTVDETQAFKTRELMEEETRSLRMVILPPEPARNVRTANRAAAHTEAAVGRSGSSGMNERADKARQDALRKEGAIHES
ncbi:MAG: hypothetical protein PVSMB4_04390 [Ktedonobacterales bacterium]